jgi:hypothetical protein
MPVPVPAGIFGLPNPTPILDLDGPAIFRILARVLGMGDSLDPGFIVGFTVATLLGLFTSGDRVILVGIPRLIGVGLTGPYWIPGIIVSLMVIYNIYTTVL